VKKYINGPAVPPSAPRRIGTQPPLIEHLAPVVDAWLTAGLGLRTTVIHERLVAEHGFPCSYPQVQLYVAGRGPRIAAEQGVAGPLTGLHRRYETTPCAQAQVDWGTGSRVIAQALGVRYVCSFNMTLSYSRNPFCCSTRWFSAAGAAEEAAGIAGPAARPRREDASPQGERDNR
jgi:hypothetical protein